MKQDSSPKEVDKRGRRRKTVDRGVRGLMRSEGGAKRFIIRRKKQDKCVCMCVCMWYVYASRICARVFWRVGRVDTVGEGGHDESAVIREATRAERINIVKCTSFTFK